MSCYEEEIKKSLEPICKTLNNIIERLEWRYGDIYKKDRGPWDGIANYGYKAQVGNYVIMVYRCVDEYEDDDIVLLDDYFCKIIKKETKEEVFYEEDESEAYLIEQIEKRKEKILEVIK